MSIEADNQRILSAKAKRLAEELDGTAEQLLALAYAGYHAWTSIVDSIFPRVASTPSCLKSFVTAQTKIHSNARRLR
ncbi:hypothetical protein [Cupriavidus agavae]|uniref:hypothetical protein n=1 Tax=Cupriavidus agavae TaxID=1001822 RepID=UPI00102C7EAE|nr:hypothetical protein [Cupriavidus agavae]